jgi:hypothetical protein
LKTEQAAASLFNIDSGYSYYELVRSVCLLQFRETDSTGRSPLRRKFYPRDFSYFLDVAKYYRSWNLEAMVFYGGSDSGSSRLPFTGKMKPTREKTESV